MDDKTLLLDARSRLGDRRTDGQTCLRIRKGRPKGFDRAPGWEGVDSDWRDGGRSLYYTRASVTGLTGALSNLVADGTYLGICLDRYVRLRPTDEPE